MMSDFNSWCRLCGGLDGSAYLSPDCLFIVEQTFEISTENLSACLRCVNLLTQISELSQRAKELARLFNGLLEENESDISIKRLNAYRSHFHLPDLIPEEVFLFQERHTQEFNTEQESEDIITETIDEAIEEEQVIEQASEEYVQEEVYIQYDGEEETEDGIIYMAQFDSSLKTEDEKAFRFTCHICDEPEFSQMKQLSQHCKTVHDTLPRVKCCSDECGSVLSTWRRLLIHKEKHFPSSDRLRCSICQKVYNSISALENHIESHNQQFICATCSKVFKELKTLRWHERIHAKPLEERRNHHCPFPDCSLRFSSKQACENHIGMKHQRSVVCVCEHCNKSFFTRKSYYEHLRNTHGERKYQCELCNFKARSKQAINLHRVVHSESRIYSCDLCTAAFSTHRRLRHHMICHSTSTPFQCPHCGSAFKRSKDLKNHINVHTKERPFNCQFCSKSFANAANCRKHKLKDHSAELKAWEEENGVGGRKNMQCYQ